jgi:hypothetical protein
MTTTRIAALVVVIAFLYRDIFASQEILRNTFRDKGSVLLYFSTASTALSTQFHYSIVTMIVLAYPPFLRELHSVFYASDRNHVRKFESRVREHVEGILSAVDSILRDSEMGQYILCLETL